jgi:hypothetical protein
MVRVRAKTVGLGIALALAARRVVRGRWAGRALGQRVGFELRAPQQRRELIWRQGHHVPRRPVRDLHLDRGDAGLQMRDAFRGEIALQLRRPRVQVVPVAGRELEHDGLVGRGVNGFGRRHNNSLALWFTVLVHARVL